MATVKHHKVVASLPAVLEPDAIYYVRAGSGFDQYVTNGAGLVVASPLNADVRSKLLDPSGLPAIRPSLRLDFINCARLDPRITFTRSSGGGRFNASGQYEWLPANEPRIDYDPVTGECRGLLIEEQRTRLNLISAAPIAPQTVTVGASAQTISFFGSGSVDLTGAHTATLLGSGPFPARRTYTFTPSAGSLTITPTGDVRMLQVEAGAFATSPIVGEGSQVTRAADIATVNELSPWYNPEQGTLVVEASTFVPPTPGVAPSYYATLQDGSSEIIVIYRSSISGRPGLYLAKSGATVHDTAGGAVIPANTVAKAAVTYDATAVRTAFNGVLGASPSVDGPPTPVQLVIGNRIGVSRAINGHIRSLRSYPRAMPDQLQALTA